MTYTPRYTNIVSLLSNAVQRHPSRPVFGTRKNHGWHFITYAEFAEALYSLESNGPLHARLGRNGREYFRTHYTWPVIERKYLEMFERLKEGTPAREIEPLPGWFDRRKTDVPAASEVLRSIPSGAAVPQRA